MKPTISAQLIIRDEEEMIGQCLANLESFKNVDEICITDSGSTDRTHDIIRDFLKRTGKRVIYTNRRFDHYHTQRNFNQRQTACDWVFRIDADETISQGFDDMLFRLDEIARDRAGVAFNQVDTFGDYYHRTKDVGRCLCLYRTKEVFFREENPFRQETRDGNEIHSFYPSCVCLTDVGIHNVVKKHHCMMKSEAGLLKKWDVMQKIDDIKDPKFEYYGLGREHWAATKKLNPEVIPLEKEWYDDVTNRDCPKGD